MAKLTKKQEKFIEEYLLESPRLQLACQLIDIRHDPMDSDIATYRWLIENDIPVQVIATKADKLGKNALQKNLAVIRKSLGVPDLAVLPYSAVKSEGRSELLDVIGDVLVQ